MGDLSLLELLLTSVRAYSRQYASDSRNADNYVRDSHL